MLNLLDILKRPEKQKFKYRRAAATITDSALRADNRPLAV